MKIYYVVAIKILYRENFDRYLQSHVFTLWELLRLVLMMHISLNFYVTLLLIFQPVDLVLKACSSVPSDVIVSTWYKFKYNKMNWPVLCLLVI